MSLSLSLCLFSQIRIRFIIYNQIHSPLYLKMSAWVFDTLQCQISQDHFRSDAVRQVGSAIIAQLYPSAGSAKETQRACVCYNVCVVEWDWKVCLYDTKDLIKNHKKCFFRVIFWRKNIFLDFSEDKRISNKDLFWVNELRFLDDISLETLLFQRLWMLIHIVHIYYV